MALSFEESVKKAMDAGAPVAFVTGMSLATDHIPSGDMIGELTVASTDIVDPGIMTLDETYGIAAYSGEDGSWRELTKYEWYSQFSDDNLSIISDTKDITLNVKQFSITQEEYSQYIPFEAPLKYDGFNLEDATLSICYINGNGEHGEEPPINVTCNNEKIRFGWLINPHATKYPGKLVFEIHARGHITGSYGVEKGYVWKTKSCDKLNVIESICPNESIVDSDNQTWMQDLVERVAESVAEEIAEQDIGVQVSAVNEAAGRAEAAAGQAESAATTAVTTALQDYSTTAEMQSYVTDAIDNADIDGKLTEYAKTEEVEALVGNLDGKNTVVEYVGAAIKTVDVTDQLTEYVKT